MNLNNLTNGAFWGMSSGAPSVTVLVPAFIIIFPPFVPIVISPVSYNIFLDIISKEPYIDELRFILYPTLLLSSGSDNIDIGVKYGN